MSTTNLGIIKSEANPLTGTRVQLNTGSWFVDESSAIKKSKIESNKTQTITENGTGIEITPSSGKEAMEKVTLTVNVPTSSITPPFWFTNGKDSVPPQEGINQMVFADEHASFDGMNGNQLIPDGVSTIAELIAGEPMMEGYTIDTVEYSGTVPSSGGIIDIFSSTSHLTE